MSSNLTASATQYMDYQLVKNALSADAVDILKHSVMLYKQATYHKNNIDQANTTAFGDTQSLNSFGFGGLVFTDSVMIHLQGRVEQFSNCKLFPTYTYGRINFNGATLEKHIDRPSCEFSVTICLHNDPYPWPIFMNGDEFSLEPGDMVCYRGTKIPHWREPFTGKKQIQLFLHYVDANGPYKDHIFDKRISLGFPSGISKNKQYGV